MGTQDEFDGEVALTGDEARAVDAMTGDRDQGRLQRERLISALDEAGQGQSAGNPREAVLDLPGLLGRLDRGPGFLGPLPGDHRGGAVLAGVLELRATALPVAVIEEQPHRRSDHPAPGRDAQANLVVLLLDADHVAGPGDLHAPGPLGRGTGLTDRVEEFLPRVRGVGSVFAHPGVSLADSMTHDPNNEARWRRLEQAYRQGPINAYYAPEIEISEGRATITIETDPKMFHAAGAVHGSVYFKMLDDAAFFAANSMVDDHFVLTVSFTIQMMRPVTRGRLISHGTLTHATGRLFFAEARLVDDSGDEIARGSGTFTRTKLLVPGGCTRTPTDVPGSQGGSDGA